MFQEFWKGLAEFNGGLVGIDFCSEDLVETINIILDFFASLFCRIQIKGYDKSSVFTDGHTNILEARLDILLRKEVVLFYQLTVARFQIL